VQSERLLVEIVDDNGAPCPPGATGRVVITDLHNFATPLLRYEIGDLAEVAPPCPCGRGLPSLARVVGRRRNLLTLPDGRTIWPVFAIAARGAFAFRELQLVQVSRDVLRARVTVAQPPPPDAAARLADALAIAFGHRFAVELEVVDSLRGPGGKLEEFVSLV
jgi:phenylacetate-CoA ligase